MIVVETTMVLFFAPRRNYTLFDPMQNLYIYIISDAAARSTWAHLIAMSWHCTIPGNVSNKEVQLNLPGAPLASVETNKEAQLNLLGASLGSVDSASASTLINYKIHSVASPDQFSNSYSP